MKKVTTASIIRQRGQITIPSSIRRQAPWVAPDAVVSVSLTNPEEILIQPHRREQPLDWDKLWQEMEIIRSFPGKSGNLSAFIDRDRQTRR